MALVCDILFVLGEEQAAKANPPVSDEDFGRGLGAEGYAAGHAAFLAELDDFFSTAGRPELAEAMRAQRDVQGAAQELAIEKVRALDPRAFVRAELLKAEAADGATPGATSMSSPASPASTPILSP